jgi:hypothetical protein
MKRIVITGVLLALSFGVSSCGRQPSSSSGQAHTTSTPAGSQALSTGSIAGTLGIVGGVLENAQRDKDGTPEAGTVRFVGGRANRIDVSVGTNGRFLARLPAGRYTVTAGLRRPMDWPMGSCTKLIHVGRYDRTSKSSYIVVRDSERLRIHIACVAG